MNQLKIIQFQGLAPSVFCGMYFADQGAEVTIIARSDPTTVSMPLHKNIMNRNKKCIELNLKDHTHLQIIRQLIKKADIIIDPYRPGVLQKLQLGPKDLHQINKRVILLRVSGYGQNGEMSLRPGHDLNYMAIGGILPLLNKKGENQFPMNYFADFVSASLGITGTLGALHQRQINGQGVVVDCSLANGCQYFTQNMLSSSIKQEINLRSVQCGDKNYIYSIKNEKTKVDEKKILQLLAGKSYYRSLDGQIEISEVKDVDPFDANTLANPFSALKLSNILKMKGEDNKDFFQNIKPKL